MADVYDLNWWGVDASLFLKDWALKSTNNTTYDARIRWEALSREFPGRFSALDPY